MKKYAMLTITLCAGLVEARSQTITAIAEQLAALKALQVTIGQGYDLVSAGLDTIGSITDAEFRLHQTYFASLEKVSPALDVTALQQFQATLIQQVNTALAYWRRQQSLTSKNE